MLIGQILLIAAVTMISRLVLSDTLYKWFLFFYSIFAIFWFQPLTTIRSLDFWLPVITLILTIWGWSCINSNNNKKNRENSVSFIIIISFLLFLGIARLIGFSQLNALVTLPDLSSLLGAILLIGLTYIGALRIAYDKKRAPLFILIILLFIFIILKSNSLSLMASQFLRRINGQPTSLANSKEIVWIGFSYFAFRLIHSLIDHQRVKEMGLSLREYITYIVFFPAFIAGPIDRIECFTKQLRTEICKYRQDDIIEGVMRITRGLFLKFILADSLALFSLDNIQANQLISSFWVWIIVYGYAFRIFFDFAGYTDIAIGLGRLAGFSLPENFNKPYLSKNITIFWNNWHITLSQWFRIYYFNPLTRFLRTKLPSLNTGIIIFVTQLSTMILIGLWHGITWNFILWGAWNGVGLFLHNQWSSLNISKFRIIKQFFESRVGSLLSIVLTFNFIALGWIWFAMPNLNDALIIFQKLLGL